MEPNGPLNDDQLNPAIVAEAMVGLLPSAEPEGS